MPRPRTSPWERFTSQVEASSLFGCWTWTGSPANRYGLFRPGGPTPSAPAHKWLWEQVHGKVPAGLELDHLCMNTKCVNPLHLEAVTHQVNTRRRSASNRATHCKYGHEFTETAPGRKCRVCTQHENAWNYYYKEK